MLPRKDGKPGDRFPELNNPFFRFILLSGFIVYCIILAYFWLTL